MWPGQKRQQSEKPDELLELFYKGSLYYQYFRQQCERHEHWPGLHNDPFSDKKLYTVHDDPAVNEMLIRYSQQYVWDLACELSPQCYQQFVSLSRFKTITGARFLLKSCELIERYNITSFSFDERYEHHNENGLQWAEPTFTWAICQMSLIARFDSDDDCTAIGTELRKFQPATLSLVFPQAVPADTLILQALGLDHLIPLWLFVKQFCRYNPYHLVEPVHDVQNSPDLIDGVIDVSLVKPLVTGDGEQNLREFIKFMKTVHISIPNTVQMLEALSGRNRSTILKKLEKRNQPALKAYGLLPITDENDCLERYLFLKQFARESKQFGPQRQASEQGAVQAALVNLAQTAGYADTTRLEWAMEARLGQNEGEQERSCMIGEYTAEIQLEEDNPQIVVSSNGRKMKSVPAPLKKQPEFLRLKEIQDSMRAQKVRFRETLEATMVEGKPLNLDELRCLAKLPVARAMLGKLIFMLDRTMFAWYDPDTESFLDMHGQAVSPSTEVFVAHPWHVYHSGRLSDWQRETIRLRIRQPFKQAFRELYLLTPAEQETTNFSTRFAGHVLNSHVVTRLFQARGWQLGSDEFSVPCKTFPSHGLKAYFYFPDAGQHYLAEMESLTSDIIYFLPRDADWYQGNNTDARLPLSEVPPLIFSEVMRDADLIVSVAQTDGETLFSLETYQRRGEVISALLEAIALPGVTIDGHFVHVKGKLANYRVHLGSAAIHIEPGNYLCVVPARWGESRQRIYLPFADEDAKLSEVISKVMLLINDDKISDPTIIWQIKNQQQI